MQTAKEVNVVKTIPAQRQKGVTLLEYAIIAALIAAVTIAIISAIGSKVNNTFATINSQLK